MPRNRIGVPIDSQYRHADIIRAMRTQDAINHFGSQTSVADALQIKQSSVAEWGEYPPDLRQLQLQLITQGALRAEPSCLPAQSEAAA